MNEKLSKLITQLKEFFAKWTLVQKIIAISIVVVAIVALVLVSTISSKPTNSALFSVPVTDDVLRDSIVFRLAEENVSADVREDGMIYVDNDAMARRMRSILVTEDLVPNNVDPWELFDVERWTTNDFLNDVNLQRSITAQITQHLESLDDIDKADVMISMPKDELFVEDQNPISASVILTTKPGSSFTSDKTKIEGVQKLLIMSIAGLKAENITITDNSGTILNDFEGMADIERVDIIEKEQLLIASFEEKRRKEVLEALQKTYGIDRVRDLNISIDMDMSQKEIATTEYFPVTIIEDNPDTPYYDGEVVESIVLSSQDINKEWKGTGYNPEGPAGVEGQNPPVYSDMSNVYGINTESSVTENNVVNTKQTQEIRSPSQGRVTVSVNIDGRWEQKTDESGALIISPNGTIEREYFPLTDTELDSVEALIQGAIGYDRARGDSVVVKNVQFDRSAQFDAEDAEYAKAEQTRRTILISVISVVSLLVLIIALRFITRELERRRRIKEEEFLRKSQLERERTLWEAQQAGMEVTMSVEEQEKAELFENAIAIAREHPEDVAMLIRTWLMEE